MTFCWVFCFAPQCGSPGLHFLESSRLWLSLRRQVLHFFLGVSSLSRHTHLHAFTHTHTPPWRRDPKHLAASLPLPLSRTTLQNHLSPPACPALPQTVELSLTGSLQLFLLWFPLSGPCHHWDRLCVCISQPSAAFMLPHYKALVLFQTGGDPLFLSLKELVYPSAFGFLPVGWLDCSVLFWSAFPPYSLNFPPQ